MSLRQVRKQVLGTDADQKSGRPGVWNRQAPPGWDGPPLPLPTLTPVPKFPLHVLPAALADYLRAAAASVGVPPDYVAAFALPLLGAAAGRSRAAAVKRTYRKPPLLWVVLVAPPSGGKSPALSLAAAPLWRAEADWRAEYEDKLAEYERDVAAFKSAEKAWKEGGCEGDPPAKPVRPTLRQAVLDDATAEAVARVLRDNPRGCVLAKDELTAFVLGQNQYKGGKGADRQFYLSCWAGAGTKVNRAADKEAPPLWVPAPFLAVAGALCPDLLPVLRGDARGGETPADGFIDRFLTVYPDPLPATGETWAEVLEPVERAYRDLVTRLLQVDLIVDADAPGGRRPFWVNFDAGGRAGWERFTTALAARQNALDPHDPFRATLGKLREYGLRLAALLWCLRHAAGEFERDAPIDADTMGRAAVLVDDFEAHAYQIASACARTCSTRLAAAAAASGWESSILLPSAQSQMPLTNIHSQPARSAAAATPAPSISPLTAAGWAAKRVALAVGSSTSISPDTTEPTAAGIRSPLGAANCQSMSPLRKRLSSFGPAISECPRGTVPPTPTRWGS